MLQRDYLDRYPAARIERERTRLTAARDRLRLLGPAATLERGYAVVLDEDGHVVRDSADTAAGRRIAVRLSRGRLAARVEEVERMSDQELTFEQARDELEETVRRLESGQTSLDEALRAVGARRGTVRALPGAARSGGGADRRGARAPQAAPAARARLTRSSQARTSRSERRRITSLPR